VLSPITTSYRHHFLYYVVNSSITMPHITHVLSPITQHHIVSYFPAAVANYHIRLRPISKVMSPITTSHRHHFPDDVLNNPITSPPIPQVMLPITTSHCVLLPRCCRQLTHHIDIIYPGADANYHITRHHFPDDVVNIPTTSPLLTYVLPPITTSHCVLFPRCGRQLPHHIDIISQMM
jgi:hypothetical protein